MTHNDNDAPSAGPDDLELSPEIADLNNEASDDTISDMEALPVREIEEEDEEAAAEKRAKLRRDDDLLRLMAKTCQVFDDLPLLPKVKEAVAQMGWPTPTPVQKLCLPWTLNNRDVAGFAQTGTGKTGVFLMTIANKLLAQTPEGSKPNANPRAVILCPTRELAMQIESDAEVIFKHTGLTSMAVFGGIDYEKQAKRIRDGVDVIMATPGRLKDYCKKKVVNLDDISVFVCDEADRMFDMGFIEDVEFFLKRIPEKSQRLLFSATTNEEVKELAFEYLEAPEYISVTPETITPERIEQKAIHCHATQKLRVMMGLLREHNPECSLIFTNTKLTAEWLHFKLVNNGIEADLITGDLPQSKRIKLIETIKSGKLKALIATDVASRGLHISRVTHVYNFDLPEEPANYVHRIGRTARAGAKGVAVSLVCDDYGQNLAAINAMLGSSLAMQSEWYDESYLTIEDKAGDPFKDRQRNAQLSREQSDDNRNRSGASGRNGPRGPRPEGSRPARDQDSSRGPRPQGGGRHDRPRGRDDQQAGGNSGPRRDGPQQGRGGQNRNAGGPNRHQDQQQGGRGNQHRGGKGRDHQDRHGGGNRPHVQGQPAFAGKEGTKATEAAAPKTLGGMIKKFAKLLFGRS